MSKIINVRNEILDLLGSDEIDAILIGDTFYDSNHIEEALQSLNHTIVVGYSGDQIPHLCVWGGWWIIIRCVYDGYTWLERLPRNPDPTYEIPDFGGD